MKNLIDQPISIKWKVFAGFAFAGLVAVGIHRYLKKQADKDPAPIYQNPRKLAQIVQKIALIVDPKHPLPSDALKLIYRAQYQLAQEDYSKEIIRTRQSRRKEMMNLPAYLNKVKKSQGKLEVFLDQKLSAVVQHLGLEKSQYLKQVEKWREQNVNQSDQWITLVQEQEELALLQIRNTQKPAIKQNVLQNILSQKINILNNIQRNNLFETIDAELTDQTLKIKILDFYVSDSIYEKFAVEEEDLNYSYSVLMEEEKVKIRPIYARISQKLSQFVERALQSSEDYY